MPGTLRFIRKVKDEHGYQASLYRNSQTGRSYLVYTSETQSQRLENPAVLAAARARSRLQALEVPKIPAAAD